jgi:magnesium chelatase subunit I
MSRNLSRTLGELSRSGYRPVPVKEELRRNAIAALKSGEILFPGIVGYEKTVAPQLVNAILARHDFILLGLRGQAKTRILRSLVRFLDEAVPAIEGSPLNEDPLHPVEEARPGGRRRPPHSLADAGRALPGKARHP